MQGFFSFDFLITPYIIGFVYTFGAIGVPFLVGYLLKKYKLSLPRSKYTIYAIGLFLCMELCWRIFCEFFMVYFKIYLSLQ
jgi:hypothetical protein